MRSRLKIFGMVLLLMAAAKVSANELLTKSELLKQAGVRLFIGEQQDKAIVFFNETLDQFNIAKDGSNVWLVTDKGAVSLKGKAIKVPVEDACGDGSDATGFIRASAGSYFIAIGDNSPTVLSWYQSKDISFTKSTCFDDVAGLGQIEKKESQTLPNSNSVISTVSIKHTYSKQEKLIKCMMEPVELTGYKETYIQPTEDCVKDNYHDFGYFKRTVVSDGGKCRIVNTAELDMEPVPNKPGDSLQSFLGTLVIKFNGKTEEWLFWDSPGYEGAGIYAIKKEDLTRRDKPSAEWVVYTGY